MVANCNAFRGYPLIVSASNPGKMLTEGHDTGMDAEIMNGYSFYTGILNYLWPGTRLIEEPNNITFIENVANKQTPYTILGNQF